MFTVRLALACALVALPGCARLEGTADCGGSPGLHVTADLSQSRCFYLTTWGIQAHLPGTTLDDALATYKREEHDPRRIVYTWSWPQDVTDGAALTIDFFGTGDAFTAGSGEVVTQAHPSDCEDVTVPVDCADTFPDAGVR